MKRLIFLLSLLFFINITLACTTDNNLVLPDNTLCTKPGSCYYKNDTNQSQFVLCDNSVNCKITTFYPNGTLFRAYESMTFITDHFEYNISSDTIGTYRAKMDCYRSKGWFFREFYFTINSVASNVTTVSGGSSGGNRASDNLDFNTYTICSSIKDFVQTRKDASGLLNYNETSLNVIKKEIDSKLFGDMKISEIEEYLKSYNSKCKSLGELYFTAMYLTGTKLQVEEPITSEGIWSKYKYWIIFLSIIIIGIIFFETNRRKKNKPVIKEQRQWSTQ